ncbi:MAG: RCC1 repeat-containing protein, partial [Bradymonadaceae bacterium]
MNVSMRNVRPPAVRIVLLALFTLSCVSCRGREVARCAGDEDQCSSRLSGLSGVVQLAAGNNHTCALLSNGTARCWGSNGFGQLGDGTRLDRPGPVVVAGLSDIADIAVGNNHTCALLAGGAVHCWGLNDYGQLGDGTETNRIAPMEVEGVTDVVQITAGIDHTCALANDGTVRCWGYDELRGWDYDYPTGQATPVSVEGLTNVMEIVAGDYHTCALLTDGTVRCWLARLGMILGDGTGSEWWYGSVAIEGLTEVDAIAAGGYHTCALLTDGTVRCWGLNGAGQLGDGTTTSRQEPVTVTGLRDVDKLTAGAFHTCALLADRTVRCWGNGFLGQLGDGSKTDHLIPVRVSALENISEIAAGGYHTCAVLIGETARCWGDNVIGQLGDGTYDESTVPVDVVSYSPAVPGSAYEVEFEPGDDAKISGGFMHTCAHLADGAAYCWGDNHYGQLGDGTTTNRLAPVRVEGLTDVVAVSA